MNQLSNDTVLYRAITKKGGLNPDNKVIDLEAFKLQFKRKIGDYLDLIYFSNQIDRDS